MASGGRSPKLTGAGDFLAFDQPDFAKVVLGLQMWQALGPPLHPRAPRAMGGDRDPHRRPGSTVTATIRPLLDAGGAWKRVGA